MSIIIKFMREFRERKRVLGQERNLSNPLIRLQRIDTALKIRFYCINEVCRCSIWSVFCLERFQHGRRRRAQDCRKSDATPGGVEQGLPVSKNEAFLFERESTEGK